MPSIEMHDRIVFTGQELEEIYKRCAPQAIAWATMYGGISEEQRKSLDTYIDEWILRDKSGFVSKFIDRKERGAVAQELSDQYLRRFAKLSGLIEVKNHFGYGPITDDEVVVTLINKPSFRWLSPSYDKYFVLKTKSIHRLEGHVLDFRIWTNGAVLLFQKDHVRFEFL
jgi:hypothetical protein